MPLFWWAAAALVNLAQANAGIQIDIRYATTNNFTHQQLYPEPLCLLRASTARRLDAVARDLAAEGLQLKVYDCYRPLSIQRRMWKLVHDRKYVAPPAQGSRHNRGAAVDLTLVDSQGRELPMGSVYDDFTEKANRSYSGLTAEEKRNRETLRRAMVRRGFLPLSTEWWHFDDPDWSRYPLLDVPLAASPRPD